MATIYDQLVLKNLSDVVGRYVSLKKEGAEYIGICPFHDDTKPSLKVNDIKGVWKCFSCGMGGDGLEFIKLHKKLDLIPALIHAGKMFGLSDDYTQNMPVNTIPDKKTKKNDKWSVDEFCPIGVKPNEAIEIYNTNTDKYSTIRPVLAHHFLDDNGNILGVEIRIKISDTEKITPIIRYGTVMGRRTWIYKGFDGVYPLYNQQVIADNTRGIILVEGPKKADILTDMGFCAVSWSNGAQAINRVDFSKLYGRSVFLWPDNDKPGIECMEAIGEKLLKNLGEDGVVRFVVTPESYPPKFDVADGVAGGWDEDKIREFVRTNVVDFSPKIIASEPIPAPPPPIVTDIPDEGKDIDVNEAPFTMLGYNREFFYYISHDSNQVVELSSAQHTVNNLFMIASLDYWVSQYPGKPFNSYHAINALMRGSKRVGLYNPDRVRGRGAWLDNGRLIIHTGSKAIVDGVETRLNEIKSGYVYEADYPFTWTSTEEATDEEAKKLLNICDRLNWERKISGRLLAGFIATAPVCGALEWRSHIWIMGAAGSGKSTVMDEIVAKIIGDIGVKIQGNTTEPALRGMIQKDARPVIFDEAENENKRSELRMESIIGLMRAGSRGGEVAKGSPSHKTTKFVTRSCFCLASINTMIKTEADESRITKLLLLKSKEDNAVETFEKLESDILKWFTNEYSSKMVNRSVKHLSTLLQNIKTFTRAVSISMKNARTGDQLGTLLAGAYLCESTDLISYEDAKKFVDSVDWKEHVNQNSEEIDMELMIELLNHNIKIKYRDSLSGTGERTIGQALSVVMGIAPLEELELWDRNDIVEKMKGIGILFIKDNGEDRFMVASTSPTIKKILEKNPKTAPLAVALNDSLKKTRGAQPHNTTYFSSGLKCRGWSFPKELLGPSG